VLTEIGPPGVLQLLGTRAILFDGAVPSRKKANESL